MTARTGKASATRYVLLDQCRPCSGRVAALIDGDGMVPPARMAGPHKVKKAIAA